MPDFESPIRFFSQKESEERNKKPIQSLSFSFKDCHCEDIAYCDAHDGSISECPDNCDKAVEFYEYHDCNDHVEFAYEIFQDDVANILDDALNFEHGTSRYYECVVSSDHNDNLDCYNIQTFYVDGLNATDSKGKRIQTFWGFIEDLRRNAKEYARDFSIEEIELAVYEDFCKLFISCDDQNLQACFLPAQVNAKKIPTSFIREQVLLRDFGNKYEQSLAQHFAHCVDFHLHFGDVRNVLDDDILSDGSFGFLFYGERINDVSDVFCELFDDLHTNGKQGKQFSHRRAEDSFKRDLYQALRWYFRWYAYTRDLADDRKAFADMQDSELSEILKDDDDAEILVSTICMFLDFLRTKNISSDVPSLLYLLTWIATGESENFEVWFNSRHPYLTLDVCTLPLFNHLHERYQPFLISCDHFGIVVSILVNGESTNWDDLKLYNLQKRSFF